MLFFQRNSSPLFSITCFSSFSVIYMCKHKNNVDFFFSKCLGGHAISLQIKPCIWVAIPVELFNIGVRVVQMDGCTYGYITTKISQMQRLPNSLKHGALLCAQKLRYKGNLKEFKGGKHK